MVPPHAIRAATPRGPLVLRSSVSLPRASRDRTSFLCIFTHCSDFCLLFRASSSLCACAETALGCVASALRWICLTPARSAHHSLVALGLPRVCRALRGVLFAHSVFHLCCVDRLASRMHCVYRDPISPLYFHLCPLVVFSVLFLLSRCSFSRHSGCLLTFLAPRPHRLPVGRTSVLVAVLSCLTSGTTACLTLDCGLVAPSAT